MFQTEKLINALNESPVFLRKHVLKLLLKSKESDSSIVSSPKNRSVLNFASKYYYSLYSPSMCAFIGYRHGVNSVAINDYASLASAKEFSDACKILNLSYALGYHAECVPLFNETQASCYTYGVPLNRVKFIEQDLKNIRVEKREHIEALVRKINSRLKKYDINLSFLEVLKSSSYLFGGAVTEKHTANILAKKLIDKLVDGEKIVEFLSTVLKISVDDAEKDFLTSKNNKFLAEDLTRVIYSNIGVFKAGETLREAEELLALDKLSGGITAYKLRFKTFNEEFFKNAAVTLKRKGFNAVAFDETSLSSTEVEKTVALFLSENLLPISVSRMGMPRQTVETTDMNETLYNSARAVIGNAISASYDVADGLFGENTIKKCQNLLKRIELFKNIV